MASPAYNRLPYSSDYHPPFLRLPTLSPRPNSPLSVMVPESTSSSMALSSMSRPTTVASSMASSEPVLRRCDAWCEDDEQMLSSSSPTTAATMNTSYFSLRNDSNNKESQSDISAMEAREDWETRPTSYHHYELYHQECQLKESYKHQQHLAPRKMMPYSPPRALPRMLRSSTFRPIHNDARMVSLEEIYLDTSDQMEDDDLEDDDAIFRIARANATRNNACDDENRGGTPLFWDDRVVFDSMANSRYLESMLSRALQGTNKEDFHG